MLRLPAFMWLNVTPMPSSSNGGTGRVRSPEGGSTLITSAPRSASTRPQIGPEKIRVRSTTRMPSSGPFVIADQRRITRPCPTRRR